VFSSIVQCDGESLLDYFCFSADYVAAEEDISSVLVSVMKLDYFEVVSLQQQLEADCR